MFGFFKKKKCNYLALDKESVIELINNEKNVIIIDARNKEEYEASHFTGSINMPVDEYEKLFKIYLKKKDQIILVYSENGEDSKMLAAELALKGYEKIVDMGKMEDYVGVLKIDKNN